MSQQVGYIRVSSVTQSTERQLESVELDKVFQDKISAKDTKRKGLEECLDYLRQGDVLHIHSIDRLARNLVDLQNIVSGLLEKKVSVKFHKESLVFSGEDDAFSKLMLQMLGSFSEFERNLIRERQREGIALAKKNGKKLGRKSSLTKEQIQEISLMAKSGKNKSEIAKHFSVSRQTIYNVLSDAVLSDVA